MSSSSPRFCPPGSVEISVPLPPSLLGNQKSSSIDMNFLSSLISPVSADDPILYEIDQLKYVTVYDDDQYDALIQAIEDRDKSYRKAREFGINLQVWMVSFGYNDIIDQKQLEIGRLKEEIDKLQSEGKNLSCGWTI